MEPEIDEREVFRLLSVATGNRLRHARWENIYADWKAGRTWEQMGKRFNRHPSTIRRLLKYYIVRSIKRNEMKWPTDALGRRLCDIPHPKPYNCDLDLKVEEAIDDPKWWCHVRAWVTREGAYCPVCKRSGMLGLPVKVSRSSSHEQLS